MVTPISKLLIANRGEIARRIIRAAHAMGIGTVAVYADGDSGEPFVREADQAIALRGRSATDSYLDQGKVLAAAGTSGADALHPGYGFLSENATFARAVIDAGMTWVGPSPQAISAMGDKLSAKSLTERAGIPNLPSHGLKPGDDAASAAEEIGFPVLVKASAGGGGKGMRVVAGATELEAAIESARREARSAFGDDTLYLERWLSKARHIEIQILGDSQGNLIHCFERECSIQRRHQKIIEEAPSPALDESMRRRMGAAAVSVARAIGYVSAGTVEFLVQDQAFWFLEMNTRLQVEHPITEAITGIDLVREQLRIAQGEALDLTQDDLRIDGHAIEARLYAEDPAMDFLPASGRIVAWTPSRSTEARYDSGIETGSTVGIEFDPMLAKVITHAPTRREAAQRLARALETTRLQGVTSNLDYLTEILRSPEFLAGNTTTDFVERVKVPRGGRVSTTVLADACIAVAMRAQHQRREAARVLSTIPSGWRNTTMPPEQLRFQHGDDEIEIEYRAGRDGTFRCQVNELDHPVRVLACNGNRIELEIDDRYVETEVTCDEDRWFVFLGYQQLALREMPRFPDHGASTVSGGLTAPMPGQVVVTHVTQGDHVEAGQLLLILEAMKMEHRITAPFAGVVAELRVQTSQQVANGELLIVLTEPDAC